MERRAAPHLDRKAGALLRTGGLVPCRSQRNLGRISADKFLDDRPIEIDASVQPRRELLAVMALAD